MSPRRHQEEGQTASSSTLQVNINPRESDENPNWRKNIIKRKEEKQEITILHPEIITILIKKPEDIAIIAQQLKDEIDTKLQKTSTSFPKPTIEEIVDEDSHKNHTQNPLPSDETILLEVKTIELENEEEIIQTYLQSENIADLWINKTNVSTELAKKENEKKEKKTLEQMVPPQLIEYKAIFDEGEATRFPESRLWDHTIDLKPDFIPKDCPIYPLSLPEQGELQKFIDNNLEKGYI